LLNKTFLSDYRYFPNIYISQGSVATRLSVVWSLMVTSLQVYCWVYWWKILKIDQHLAKLWAKAAFPVFLDSRRSSSCSSSCCCHGDLLLKWVS